MKKVDVKESTVYDNFVGKKEQTEEPQDLTDILGIEVKEPESEDTNNWKKHWVGMPEYKQEDNPPYMKIYMNFRNKEDYEKFAKLIDQNLTEKTKSIWYPKLDREENALLRWIEADE